MAVRRVSQPTSRDSIFPATSFPPASLIALATIASAWPAAGYGALVIWAAGDFASTGSRWGPAAGTRVMGTVTENREPLLTKDSSVIG